MGPIATFFRKDVNMYIDNVMLLPLVQDKLCRSIISSNKNIQAVAIINKQGRVVEKTSRKTFNDQFPDSVGETFFMQCVLQVSIGKDFDDHYGQINYYVSERKNLTTLTLPLDDYVILVTMNKNVSPITLARKIAGIIDATVLQHA